ncbi:exo-alpha-sialidase [Candidatus Bathyarchaeota archaeon]|nr:MAG: exo-alpha-sialidase [Candidatus Bathyarchaeota archaeon]
MVKILYQRTIIRNGWHNAFTDLCFWHGSYWLTFRRGSAHVSPDGGIVIMRSVDLLRWRQVAFLKTRGDDRDPKFCPTANRLYVYFGTWLPRPEGWPDERFGPLVTHVSFTEDGAEWSRPIPAYKQNYWLWRVRYHDGIFYSPAYGWDDPREKHKSFLDLLTSEDGLKWSKKCRIGEKDQQPDEADIWFQPDGELWCIARTTRNPDHSLFYSSKPPYEEWECVDLKVTIHCPVFCQTNGRLYVAGRRRIDSPWIPQTVPAGNTGIFIAEKGKVKPFLALPTYGDAAYPGLISPEPGKLLISYYSQHAYLSGVVYSCSSNVADIYIAEISTE